MRTAQPFLFLLASMTLAFAPAPLPKPRRGDLLVNGSFEDGPTVGKYQALAAGSQEVSGWVVTRGQIDVVSGAHWKAARGGRSIDLHGSPGLGGVSQTFSTTPGRDWHQGLEYYRRNLRHVVRIAKANGIRVLMASQPACDSLRNEPGFAAYNAAAQALARDEGVTFVDLAGAVTDDASFLPDCIHNTRAGVERVADTMYEPLRRLVEEVERERAKR